MVRPIDHSAPLPQQPSVQGESSSSSVQPQTGTNVQSSNQTTSETSHSQTTAVRTDEGYTAARMTEHSMSGQARAAQLHSQIIDREVRGRVMDDPQPQPQTTSTTQQPQPAAPPPPSMQSVLQDSGMRRVSNPPSENDLRTYYSRNAPAHDQIRQGHFDTAAAEYRRLADASTNLADQTRLRTTANQLDITNQMQQAGVRNLSFPPTEANVQSYFSTMRGRPLNDIQNAFQGYARAFYVHSETRGVDRGDVTYDPERHTIGNERWTTRSPEDWNDITNSREMHTDGRRIMDCEGYAYLGQRALQAAGFSGGQYAAASREDNPNTTQNEQFSNQHMMYSATRTVRDPDGTQRTEVLAISNDRMFQGASAPNPSAAESETAEIRTLTQAYQQTFRRRDGAAIHIPGGIMVREPQAWRAQISLDQALGSQ